MKGCTSFTIRELGRVLEAITHGGRHMTKAIVGRMVELRGITKAIANAIGVVGN